MNGNNAWIAYALGAAASWGVWGILNKLALARVGWPVLVVANAALYVVGAAAILIWSDAPRGVPASSWALALAAAVAGTGAMLLFYAAFRGGHAAAAAVVPLTALYPAVTAVLAIWLLRERLAPAQYVGVVLAVVAAVLIARGK